MLRCGEVGVLYNEFNTVSIVLAKKSLAPAKSHEEKGPYYDKPLAEFLRARIGYAAPKMTANEVSENGGPSPSYISELRKGKNDPASLSVAKLVSLAKGMDVSPVLLFSLAKGDTTLDPQEDRLRQTLRDYGKLSTEDRNDVEFLVRELRSRIRHKLRE